MAETVGGVGLRRLLNVLAVLYVVCLVVGAGRAFGVGFGCGEC